MTSPHGNPTKEKLFLNLNKTDLDTLKGFQIKLRYKVP